MQGEQYSETAQALRDGDLDRAPITPAERKLLEFVETLTRHAYRITDEQVQELRDVGWTDAQIAEAVYDGALFNLFVRLAESITASLAHIFGSVTGLSQRRLLTRSSKASESPQTSTPHFRISTRSAKRSRKRFDRDLRRE